MRRIYNTIVWLSLSVIFTLCSVGCTHMDGDIGELFGRWNLVSLTADGVEQHLYDEGASPDDVLLYTWSFQGDLAWILTLYPHHSYHMTKGMWTRTDTRLTLDFAHHDDEGADYYTPPEALHLSGVTELNIESMTSSDMTLWYVSDDDVRYEYKLSKAY